MKKYEQIAKAVEYFKRINSADMVNPYWKDRADGDLETATCDLPSGSGIDNGTKLDLDASNANKLVFTFGFHFLNENGFYDGWGDYKAIVRPSLCWGMDLRIVGRDRNQIKDYLHSTFEYYFNSEVN